MGFSLFQKGREAVLLFCMGERLSWDARGRETAGAVLSLEQLQLVLWNFGLDLIRNLLGICIVAVLVSCVVLSRSFGFYSVDASTASSDFSWSTIEYSGLEFQFHCHYTLPSSRSANLDTSLFIPTFSVCPSKSVHWTLRSNLYNFVLRH